LNVRAKIITMVSRFFRRPLEGILMLELIFGLLTGLAVAGYVMLEFVLGFHSARYDMGQYADLALAFVPLLLLLLGMFKASSRPTPGARSLGRSIVTGLLISFIGAVLSTAFMLWYLKSLNPHYIDVVLAFERDKLLSTGMPDEIMVQKVNEMRLRYGVGARLIWGFFRQLGLGAAVTVLLAVYFTRRGQAGGSGRS
jgi:hypothetical protein